LLQAPEAGTNKHSIDCCCRRLWRSTLIGLPINRITDTQNKIGGWTANPSPAQGIVGLREFANAFGSRNRANNFFFFAGKRPAQVRDAARDPGRLATPPVLPKSCPTVDFNGRRLFRMTLALYREAARVRKKKVGARSPKFGRPRSLAASKKTSANAQMPASIIGFASCWRSFRNLLRRRYTCRQRWVPTMKRDTKTTDRGRGI